MTRKIATRLLFVALGFALTSCATPSRFEWANYESALYIYAKKPDHRPQYQAALEDAIAKGRQTNRVAPGMLAELGYLHLQDGDTKGAVALFQEEMALFPEAKPFMTKIIARVQATEKQGTEVKS